MNIPAAAALLRADADLYVRKAADYAPNADPWENFRGAAEFAGRVCRGLATSDPRRATATLVGIKLSRLATLGLAGQARNEAVTDTLADLRVYAAILEAQHREAADADLEAERAFERMAMPV